MPVLVVLQEIEKHEQIWRWWHTLYCRALHAVACIRVGGVARGVCRMPPLLSAHMRIHSLCKCSIMYHLPKEVSMRYVSPKRIPSQHANSNAD